MEPGEPAAEAKNRGPGPDRAPEAARYLAEIQDLADDVITVGGSGSEPELPGGGELVIGELVIGEPVIQDLVVREPVTRDPVTQDPVTREPEAAKPVRAKPGGAELAGGRLESERLGEAEPNGWFVGPDSDPDQFELLGRGLAGGEGNIWRGRYRGELAAPLTLAVKELRRPPHATPDWPTPADLRRWTDQRALLQYMQIDHLVTVIDVFVGSAPHLPGSARGAPPNTPYVVMEWVPGPTLADELSGSSASASTLDQRLAHVQHVAEALHSLHSRTASAGNPSLHRDVKPTNCILHPRRGVVLVDVGTMRRMDDGYDHDGLHTPAYTAPEVLANLHTARAASSDLYSLGALAYFCVVGEDPPVSDRPGAGEQIRLRLRAVARSAQVADPEGFVDQLQLMLDPSPEQRPADAMSWSRRLRSSAAVRRPRSAVLRSGRAKLAAGSIAVAAVVVVGTLHAVFLGPLRGTHAEQTAGGADPTAGAAAAGAVSPVAVVAGASPSPSAAAALPPEGGPGAPLTEVPPAVASPDPNGTIKSAYAMITFPRPGASADRCTVIKGTSKLAAGQTLLSSVENLERGDGAQHLQIVRGWTKPASLRDWESLQFIGLPQDRPGGTFRIRLIMTPLAALTQQVATGGGEGGRWRRQFPTGSTVVASIVVTRA
ncbi:MAG TPA: protein kinase, partial [Propionibacteriaceae bacterium]|nr:protein kinase [Propionibacteriaceae bacterium]